VLACIDGAAIVFAVRLDTWPIVAANWFVLMEKACKEDVVIRPDEMRFAVRRVVVRLLICMEPVLTRIVFKTSVATLFAFSELVVIEL
jgi:hypothetical protein